MRQKILRELWKYKGNFMSGSKLAGQLGISRVAVWKHIEALKEEGYDITGIKGKGYSLKDYKSLIIPDEVVLNINNRLIGREIRFYTRVGSTNEIIKRMLIDEKLKEGTVVVAGRQEKGRGRLGRRWESPRGGLWFSLLLSPNLPLTRVALLSLVFAVAIARGLENFISHKIKIKWPNDIYVEDKKIAGILLELSGEFDGADYVIAGIGVNVNIKSSDFTRDLKDTATSLLEQCSESFDNSEVLIRMLQSIEDYYFKFIDYGFTDILEEFKGYCMHLGKEIQVNQCGRIVSGINTDIDIMGNLVINTGQEVIKISTGDINVI